MSVEATVIGYDGDRVRLAVARGAGCTACAEGRGCGMGLLGRTDRAPQTLVLPAPRRRPPVGSSVVLHGTPGVAIAALAGYGLPLSGLLAGAAAGPVAAAVGLAAGVLIARRWARDRVAWRLTDDASPQGS